MRGACCLCMIMFHVILMPFLESINTVVHYDYFVGAVRDIRSGLVEVKSLTIIHIPQHLYTQLTA